MRSRFKLYVQSIQKASAPADKASQLQAKAVVERDLSKIRKKRAERERRPSPPSVKSPSKLLQTAGDDETAILAEILPTTQGGLQQHDQDTTIPDAPFETNGVLSIAAGSSESMKLDGNEQAITSLEGMPQDTQNTTGLAISIPNDPKSGSNADDILAELAQPSDATKNDEDFDFDSMFNDTGMVAQDGTIDFDMDFSTEGNNTQNIMGDAGMEGISLNNAELSNAMPATNEDLNSLLPGLENYVNASNDPNVSNPVGNGAATLENLQIPDNANGVGTNLPPAAETALADSSFEDFFNAADFNMNEGNGTGEEIQIGDGNFEGFSEFNEDWF